MSVLAERELNFRKSPSQNTGLQLTMYQKPKPFDRHFYHMFKNTYLLSGQFLEFQTLPFNSLGKNHRFNEKATRAMNLNGFSMKLYTVLGFCSVCNEKTTQSSISAEKEFDFRKWPSQNTCTQQYRCHKHKLFDRYNYQTIKNTYLLIGPFLEFQPLPFNSLGTNDRFNKKIATAMHLNGFSMK